MHCYKCQCNIIFQVIQWNVTWKVSRPLNKTSSNNSSFLALSAKKEVLLLLLLLCGTYLPLFLLCRCILLLMGNVEDCLPTPSTRALTNSAMLGCWYHWESFFFFLNQLGQIGLKWGLNSNKLLVIFKRSFLSGCWLNNTYNYIHI